MHSSSRLVFNYCKVLGIAPFRLINNEYTFNTLHYFWNICFLVCLIIIGLHALISDYRSTFRGKSMRMKTRTAVVVTFLEIFLSMIAIASGIVGSIFSYSKIVRINALIKKIDDILGSPRSFFNFNIIICYLLAHHIALIGVDIKFWFNLTSYSWSYTVCYIYTFVELAIEAQFALIVLQIRARFGQINNRLENYFRRAEFRYANALRYKRETRFSFESFLKLHWSLRECVQMVNEAFGWQMLTSILCICVHIIVTPYFLLLDLFYPAAYGSADLGFLVLQVIWIVTHHLHLFLVVIPASAASYQAKQAGVIICEHLGIEEGTTELDLGQLEIFVLQLKKHPVKFNACRLFCLQRSVITSLIGSIVTYLVILIQFQNSDKVFH